MENVAGKLYFDWQDQNVEKIQILIPAFTSADFMSTNSFWISKNLWSR